MKKLLLVGSLVVIREAFVARMGNISALKSSTEKVGRAQPPRKRLVPPWAQGLG
jgi:hypothetical protein